MKCIGCGKKLPAHATVCPLCGKSQTGEDFDEFPSGSDFQTGGNDFDVEPVSTVSVRKKAPSAGKGTLLLIAGGILLIAALAAMILLHNRKPSEAILPAFVAPTGHTERIDEGRGILLNELLVIPDETMTRRQLEKLVQQQGGALIGYFPEIGQYQVRFNFTTKEQLDTCKRSLEGESGILRVDYNILLTVSCETNPEDLDIMPGNKEVVGILGYWIPDDLENVNQFYLPSIAFPTEKSLNPDDESVTESGERFASKWTDLVRNISDGRTVLVASAFYYDYNEDGSLFVTTTSAALRYQIAQLLSAGAEWICIPIKGPAYRNEELLEQETAQMELLISAAEKKNPRFLMFKAQEGNDWLSMTLNRTESIGKHCLTVSACGEPFDSLLNLTGLDVPVLQSAFSLVQTDLCVQAPSAEIASIRAVLYSSELYHTTEETDLSGFRYKLTGEGNAVAGDKEGFVRPAFISTASEKSPVRISEGLLLFPIHLVDKITGLPVSDAVVRSEGRTLSVSGTTMVMAQDGVGTVSVTANGYQDVSNQEVSLSSGTVELVPEASEGQLGFLHGSVTDASGRLSGNVQITAREAGTDTVRLSKTAGDSFDVSLYQGEYDVTITSYDRTEVTVYGVAIRAGETTDLPEIKLSVPSDIKGEVSGTIKDAMDGNPLEGVTLRFFRGLNTPDSGAPDLEVVTGRNGDYHEKLPGGFYTLYLSKEGYRSVSITVYSEDEKHIGDQNCTITPTVPEGQVRIVLEWGEKPSDLDSHLVNRKQGIHVYYSNMSAYIGERKVVNLDVDDMHSYGPETTTILQMLSGKYVFYVHDYSNKGKGMNSNALSLSGAKVTVYMGSNDPLIFHVPSGNGVVWEVFSMENGVITPGSGMVAERTMW